MAYATRQQDALNEKACTIYFERLEAAQDSGASDEELDAINSHDVTLTIWDRIAAFVAGFRLVALVQGIVHFYTMEPDYSDVCPSPN